MAVIAFPAMSTSGRRAQETGGRLINCYASEVQGAPANPVIWHRAAGLRRVVENTAYSGCRGFVAVGNVLLYAVEGQVYSVVESGGALAGELRGPLAGSQPVTVAQNVASTPNTVCVTENGAFNLYPSAAPSGFADGDLPSPNSVAYVNGYMIFSTAGGQIWATGLNNVSVDTNSYVAVPKGSLLRVIEYGNEIYAFGDWGFRVYQDVGASPFPLEYAQIEKSVGLAGTHAIAGDQSGWSDALIFAGADNRVYRMEGYTPVPISTPDVSRALEAVVDRAPLVASVYVAEGYSFWTLTNPGSWTWEYNLSTGLWNERKSYGRNDWRGRRSIRMFDKWIIGDAATGDLLEVVAGYGYERDEPLVYTLYSGILTAFPNRINAVRSWFRFTAGVGVAAGADPIETAPRVAISWSRDGGATFGNPVHRELGREGDTDALVSIGNTGLSNSKGLQVRLEISDPVHAGFMGGDAQLESFAP